MEESLQQTDGDSDGPTSEPGQNQTEPGPGVDEGASVAIDDLAVRGFGILGFGVAIPNATGLFGTLGPRDVAYWLGYLWFFGLAFVLWNGNRWLLLKQRRHLDWFSHPLQKVVLLLFAIICFTAPATVGWLAAWFEATGLPRDDHAIQSATLVNVICVVFVSHVYETVFLIKERSTDMVQLERVERARAQAQLDALRAQIDPHFLFNSLNTLSFLIEDAPDKARAYTETLARVYRYILMHRDRDLVLLTDELALVDDYFFLLKLRFGDALHLDIAGRDENAAQLMAIPMSLQTLLENAVKHNVFSAQNPLHIELSITDAAVSVSHPHRPRPARDSSKVGLHNLDRRHKLVLGAGIDVERGERFRVTVTAVKAA